MNAITLGLGDLLLIAFVVLKLTGIIHWSWLWVLSPLWLGFVVIAVICVIQYIIWSKI